MQRALCTTQRMFGPVVRQERRPSWTSFIRARLVQWSPEPSIGKLVLRWRFSHLLGVRRQRLVYITLIQLLSVHVRMRLHHAALYRSICPEREMPRIHTIPSIHSEWQPLALKTEKGKKTPRTTHGIRQTPLIRPDQLSPLMKQYDFLFQKSLGSSKC